MPVFAFEAMDNKGQKVKKEIEAGNREDAISKIKAKLPLRFRNKRLALVVMREMRKQRILQVSAEFLYEQRRLCRHGHWQRLFGDSKRFVQFFHVS